MRRDDAEHERGAADARGDVAAGNPRIVRLGFIDYDQGWVHRASGLPVLSFGWWSAIGGEGNPVVGVSNRDLGIASVVIPLFFIGLLIVGMPLLVAREEWVFRRGAEERGTAVNLGRSVVFGLAHAVVGIPIGAALALSIGGLYLTRCYLNGWKETRSQTGALLESTRAHLAYNLTIVALVLVSLLVLVATGTT
jgi:hypothetical protein